MIEGGHFKVELHKAKNGNAKLKIINVTG